MEDHGGDLFLDGQGLGFGGRGIFGRRPVFVFVGRGIPFIWWSTVFEVKRSVKFIE